MGNWDFSGDEAIFFLLAGFFGAAGLIKWYAMIARVRGPARSGAIRFALALIPVALLAGLLYVLQHWSDPKYVVGQLDYILMFMSGGASWLWVTHFVAWCMGVSARDDALERGNAAAATAVGGAMTGSMCVYAWCNVGAGPTIWTTLWPALVASLVWLGMWFTLEQLAHVSDAIAIDRDAASAWRLAGVLIGSGLILGRAMAGDFRSWGETFGSFVALGWPALALPPAAVVMQRVLGPTPARPHPAGVAAGLIPAIVIVGACVAYVAMLGAPDIGVHVITYEEYTGHSSAAG